VFVFFLVLRSQWKVTSSAIALIIEFMFFQQQLLTFIIL